MRGFFAGRALALEISIRYHETLLNAGWERFSPADSAMRGVTLSAPSAALVVTTINDPALLEDYFANFERYGHAGQVRAFVIPDTKTPASAYRRVEALAARGFRCTCPSLEAQEQFLRRVEFDPALVPVQSDNRRNVGYLMALDAGVDFIMSIDDDNYCMPEEDYFAAHAIVCAPAAPREVVESGTRWFNICSLIEFDGPAATYPRGFPYFARHRPEQLSRATVTIPIAINAGLWVRDPDVDAISWLVNPVLGRRLRSAGETLGRSTWAPVNTQNTALHRAAAASYYFVKMRYPLAGMPIDRYGDIFSGYFAQACARALGEAVRFGTPVAEHRRNSHNYMQDAAGELACIMVLEDVLPWLTEVALEGATYPETYTSLSFALEDAVEHCKGSIWNDAVRAYFHQMAYHMRTWARVCASMGTPRRS